jgi:stage III sporulation protein AE
MSFEEVYQLVDLSEIEEKFGSLFPTWDISFAELFQGLLNGNAGEVFMNQGKDILYAVLAEMDAVKYVCVTLLLIGVVSTVFMNFSNIFPKQQIADFGFQFTYLILIIFLVKVNVEVFAVAKNGLEGAVSFLHVFIPSYFLVVGLSGGSATAFGFYQVFLIAIYFVEQILATFVLPLISCYMLLCIMNGIWEEERLSLFIGLIKKSIQTFLKVLLTMAVGSGMFQSLITPVIDTTKLNTVKKTVEAIPGIGDLADGSIQVMMGMGVLLKNTMGILFIVLLLFICAMPILKVFFFMFVVKGCAGIMGLSADKRIINCTNAFGDGIMLLLQTMITAVMFFLILILLVTFSTNRGYL